MRAARIIAVTALLLAACGHRDASVQTWFVEDSARSGLDFVHAAHDEQHFWLPEIMGSGVALFDYDGDGWLDAYCVQSGSLDRPGDPLGANRLFRNRGDGTFVDVTVHAGVGDVGYGMGVACGDYDGDGDVDLYVTNLGANVLYQNQGDGTFRDVSALAGCAGDGWSVSAAFVDVDRDGDLDLFVARYIEWRRELEHDCRSPAGTRDYCHPASYQAPARDLLFENRGDGTFVDVSERAGLRAASGNGLGVACGDFDGDGWPDVYVANDMNANQLWINRRDGTFVDEALQRGCALSGSGQAEAGMGVQAVDVDQDGDLDLFVTNLRNQKNTLYLNDGHGRFDDKSAERGLGGASLPFTGFGLGFHDFDSDGQLDLFVADGRVLVADPSPRRDNLYAEENLLFRGHDGGRFEELLPRGGVEPPLIESSRGAAVGDIDGDGDIDVLVLNRRGPLHLLRNRIAAPGAWIQFDVRDERGRTAIGARVQIEVGCVSQYRQVDPCYSYASSSDARVHFGLGSPVTVDHARVRWPDGVVQDFGTFPSGACHVLRRAGR